MHSVIGLVGNRSQVGKDIVSRGTGGKVVLGGNRLVIAEIEHDRAIGAWHPFTLAPKILQVLFGQCNTPQVFVNLGIRSESLVRQGVLRHQRHVVRAVREKGLHGNEQWSPILFAVLAHNSFYDIEEMSVSDIADAIIQQVGERKAYLTFDIDCLDPAYAPGTGTPVAGGPSSAKILSVLRKLGALTVVGSDVVEVAPAYDHADITAIAGATVAMYMLGLHAEKLAERSTLR